MKASDPEMLLYLDTSEQVELFLDDISGAREIALDTEGASFHRFVDRIYLLQISTRDQSAVVDPLPIGAPARLGAILGDQAIEVVFHDADYDLRLLHQDYGWHINNIFDTQYFDPGIGPVDGVNFAARVPQPGRTMFLRLLSTF